MPVENKRILMAAAAAAVAISSISLVEGILRGVNGGQIAIAILGGAVFFGVLSAQLLRPESFRLACLLSFTAVAFYIFLPALTLLKGTSESFPAIDILPVAAILTFTYSFVGWAALVAGVAFVAALAKWNIVTMGAPGGAEGDAEEDS